MPGLFPSLHDEGTLERCLVCFHMDTEDVPGLFPSLHDEGTLERCLVYFHHYMMKGH